MLIELFDKYRCDKGHKHGYDKVYEPIFAKLRNEPITLLEIGILRGQSLSAWVDYFPQALVIGIDTFDRVPPEDVDILFHPRVHWFRCDSTRDVPEELTEKLDIIIDDGNHIQAAQLATLRNYMPLLKPDGVYFIEDVLPFDAKQPKAMNTRYLENTVKGYAELVKALEPYKVAYHDCRDGHEPGSFIIEVRHGEASFSER